MRIVTYNIFEGGFASDGADRSEAIQTVLNSTQPDIIALQEVNREGFLYSLARFFNMPTALFGPGNRGFNLGLLSKYPVTDWQMHEERAIFRHGFLEAHLTTPTGPLAVFVAHLYPGYDENDDDQRVKEAEVMLKIMQPYFGEAALLVGDFNTINPHDEIHLEDWPRNWQKYLAKQNNVIKRESLAKLLDAGYIDCYRTLHTERGYTLPASRPNARLDHIFASPSLATQLQSCEIVTAEPASRASDHLPLLSDFSS